MRFYSPGGSRNICILSFHTFPLGGIVEGTVYTAPQELGPPQLYPETHKIRPS